MLEVQGKENLEKLVDYQFVKTVLVQHYLSAIGAISLYFIFLIGIKIQELKL